jgi:hypothetical protein
MLLLLSPIPAHHSLLGFLTRQVRVLRLIKLVRVLRTARLLVRWESRLSIDYGTLALVGCFVAVVLAAHWFSSPPRTPRCCPCAVEWRTIESLRCAGSRV